VELPIEYTTGNTVGKFAYTEDHPNATGTYTENTKWAVYDGSSWNFTTPEINNNGTTDVSTDDYSAPPITGTVIDSDSIMWVTP
jgi:hypothetical protein